jgi:hypothetical protein
LQNWTEVGWWRRGYNRQNFRVGIQPWNLGYLPYLALQSRWIMAIEYFWDVGESVTDYLFYLVFPAISYLSKSNSH